MFFSCICQLFVLPLQKNIYINITMYELEVGTLLKRGDYKIVKKLGQGGFGITYLAEHTMLGSKVAVKEFFMKDFCNRDEATSHVSIGSQGSTESVERYREKFLKEARNIARLKHPHIVRVTDVFEENGTAYYVMEYAEGGSLSAKVKSMGYMPLPMAINYIKQVASALDYIHRNGMNHLDVKPANVMLNENDDAVLIDFGLSKQYDASNGGQTSSTPVGISEGYAPLEQYKQGGVSSFSPETDIYSLGATLYTLLTGVIPPTATDIYEDDLPIEPLKKKGVPQAVINVIVKAMEPRKKKRLNSASEFILMLEKAPSTADESTKIVADEATVIPAGRDEATVMPSGTNEATIMPSGVSEATVMPAGRNEATIITSSQVVSDSSEPSTDEDAPSFFEQYKKHILGGAAAVLILVIGFAMFNRSGDANSDSTSVVESMNTTQEPDTSMMVDGEPVVAQSYESSSDNSTTSEEPAEAKEEKREVKEEKQEVKEEKREVREERQEVREPEPEPEPKHRSAGHGTDFSWLSQRRCTYNDIAGCSSWELCVLRNSMYARHGRKFKRADLRAYFSQFSWYQPLYDEVELTSIEQANVAFIKRYE